jgi:hypothetical protein
MQCKYRSKLIEVTKSSKLRTNYKGRYYLQLFQINYFNSFQINYFNSYCSCPTRPQFLLYAFWEDPTLRLLRMIYLWGLCLLWSTLLTFTLKQAHPPAQPSLLPKAVLLMWWVRMRERANKSGWGPWMSFQHGLWKVMV